ncbi:MAG: carboxypeptidase regulatory-like domain-containing protein [Acidobacteria bacterium]|nr:carboxypeptidase regulatory-like domain-containing protein [Acidobacteriota bacterium]
MRIRSQFLLVVLGLLIVDQGEFLYAQMGRASITGIVSDASGAIVPGVTVTATQTGTQVTTETTTNDVGNYTISALPIGQYSISFTKQGFRIHSRAGLDLGSGQVARIDVTLDIGEVSDQVTVTGEASLLQTESAQASKSVTASVFADLPLNFSGGRNMQKFADKLVPGVNGDIWRVKVQGTPGGTQNVVIDGTTNTAGMLPGDFAEASISPEAIQEMTVFTGNQSAEYGRTGGGTLNFVLKSGTNDVHGSAFYYLQNEFLNANTWANNLQLARDPNFTNPNTARFTRPKNRQNVYGGSVGGPVYIPKLYNGRNRTFFYVTVEKFEVNNRGATVLERTAPQPEMLNGDFSRLLGTQVGTDALGRPVREGQIYDPATLQQVNGQFVADPFPGNIIPANRLSQTVVKNFVPIFREHYVPATTELNNNLFNSSRLEHITRQTTIKGDHAITSAHKLSGFLYLHEFPRQFQRRQPGMWSVVDADNGGPLSTYAIQERHGYSWNVSHDWIVTPTLLNRFTFGHNVHGNDNLDRRIGQKLHETLGIKGVPQGVPEDQVTAPTFTLGGSPVMNVSGMWVGAGNYQANFNAWVLSDNVTWQRGTHNIKLGFEWHRQAVPANDFGGSGGDFTFQARTTGIPGFSYSSRIGNSFASFMLGEVNSASLGVGNVAAALRHSFSAFAQDSWKATPKLTLNIGVRWSADTAITENDDRQANFSPTLIDPATNLPGAVEYMGFGPGRAGRRAIQPGYYKNIGPTFGLAWRLRENLVWRAGYGMTYTPETIATAHGFGPVAFAAGFPLNNSVPADSRGENRPVFNLDNGYPGVTQPRNLDPSWGNRFGAAIFHPDVYRSAYVQHFNFGFQYQLTSRTVIEADWRATKGTRFRAGTDVYPNQIRKEELKRGSVLGQIIDSPEKAAAAGLPYPYPGFAGTGAHTLLPFPQLGNRALIAYGDPIGFSNYQSGNLIITKRLSKGILAYGAYTFAKSITNLGNNGAIRQGFGSGIGDHYNRTLYKAIDQQDRTHVIKMALSSDLPFGRGKPILGNAHPVLNAIIGGWNVAAIINWRSGTPIEAPVSRVRPVGWNGPTVLANFNAPPSGFRRVFDPSKFNPFNPADPGNRFFDPAAFSDSAPTDLGNSPIRFPWLRNLWSWSEDVTIQKRFPLTERFRLELRVEFFNFFNRHFFATPDLDRNNASFGNIRTANGNRVGQAGLRLDW